MHMELYVQVEYHVIQIHKMNTHSLIERRERKSGEKRREAVAAWWGGGVTASWSSIVYQFSISSASHLSGRGHNNNKKRTKSQ